MYKVNRFQIYLVLLIALFLHLGPLDYIKIFGVKPDALLMSVIFFGLFLGGTAGLETGIVAGALKDLFAFDFLGINTFVLGIAGLTVGSLNTKFSRDSKIAEMILVFTFAVFSMSLHFILVSIFLKNIALSYPEYLTISILPAAIYTSLVSIPIFAKLIEIYNLKESEEYL